MKAFENVDKSRSGVKFVSSPVDKSSFYLHTSNLTVQLFLSFSVFRLAVALVNENVSSHLHKLDAIFFLQLAN